jgi:hypothetical protein
MTGALMGKKITVPAYYRKLHEPGYAYRFDSSPEAWLWKQVRDLRDETLIEAAGAVIEAYSEMGSYSSTGEDFYLIAELMSCAGWGDEEDLEEFLAANRPEIERRVREIHARRGATRKDNALT